MKIIGFFEPLAYELAVQLMNREIEVICYDENNVDSLTKLEEEMLLSIGRNALFSYEPFELFVREQDENDFTIIVVKNSDKFIQKITDYIKKSNIANIHVFYLESNEKRAMQFISVEDKTMIPAFIGKWVLNEASAEENSIYSAETLARYIVENLFLEEKKQIDFSEVPFASSDEIEIIQQFNKKYLDK